MSIINYASREIQFKIVYYGPALCGKTTNLGYIHQRINPENRGDLVSLATASDRTLFFDFLPLNAVVIKGFVTKFQLYTVPGQ
nr:gliding-motility protein MglA [Chthoniobacterales bacterium]